MSESKQAYYEKLVYNELMTRELVNYDRVLAKSETLEALSDRQKDRTVSAYSDHNVLKKAFIVVIDLLKLVEGNDCVVIEGGTRNRVFHYVGERSDPLGNTNCRMIKDVKLIGSFVKILVAFSLKFG